MSTSSIQLPFIRVTAITVSPESSKCIISGGLRIGPHQHKLLRSRDGTLRQEFSNVLELSPETRIMIYYKSRLLLRKKEIQVDTHTLFASPSAGQTQDLSVTQDDLQITFKCIARTLTPSTDTILESCSEFRILVIGKTGVGKSSLINVAFGINKAAASDLQRGKADIEQGLESPVNKRFILHDSLGFEPGDQDNYDTVKNFIRNRQTGPLGDQLHAVWYCIQTPRAGGRLLEAAAEDFFRTKKETMGTIPLIVVYTALDLLVNDLAKQSVLSAEGEIDYESIVKEARSKALSIVLEQHGKIAQLAEDPLLPHAAVSARKNYKDTVESLVELTHHQVGIRDTPEAQTTSAVTLMAQRIGSHLKIQGSINIGRQRYWKALKTSPDFKGHRIWDCLSVIHADIVTIWNFNDPNYHLQESEFKELVIKMVQEMDMPSLPNPSKILALGGGSLIAAVSGFMAAIANPAAPIVLPVIAGTVVAAWLYLVYQNVKNVQKIFIAFIVDLTHIMETLFILTVHDHHKLTRRAIKLAYSTYYSSNVKRQAHTTIQAYHDLDGQDAALEMIESLIKPERCGEASVNDYYAEVNKLKLDELHLEQEEELFPRRS